MLNKDFEDMDKEFHKFLRFGKLNAEKKRIFYKQKRDLYTTLLRGYENGSLSLKDLKQSIKKDPKYYKEILRDLRTLILLNNN